FGTRTVRQYVGCVLHSRDVTLRRFAVAAIVAICIGGPVLEMFDRWDHTLQDGNDTEANVVFAALCVGAVVAISTIVVVARIRTLASNSRLNAVAPPAMVIAVRLLAAPTPTKSHPTPLRV